VATGADLRLLHRIHVLVASRDRRFLRLARFLLTRQGHAVETTATPGDVFERLENGVNVVVVDASPSLATAARTVAEIEVLHPDIGVVVVGDGRLSATAFRLLSKWGAPERLDEEIRRVYLRLDGR